MKSNKKSNRAVSIIILKKANSNAALYRTVLGPVLLKSINIGIQSILHAARLSDKFPDLGNFLSRQYTAALHRSAVALYIAHVILHCRVANLQYI